MVKEEIKKYERISNDLEDENATVMHFDALRYSNTVLTPTELKLIWQPDWISIDPMKLSASDGVGFGASGIGGEEAGNSSFGVSPVQSKTDWDGEVCLAVGTL